MPRIPIKKRIRAADAEGKKARELVEPLEASFERAFNQFKDPKLIASRYKLSSDVREFVRQWVFREEKAPSMAHVLRYLQGTSYMATLSKKNPELARTIISEISKLEKR